jgi:hypothetical protein
VLPGELVGAARARAEDYAARILAADPNAKPSEVGTESLLDAMVKDAGQEERPLTLSEQAEIAIYMRNNQSAELTEVRQMFASKFGLKTITHMAIVAVAVDSVINHELAGMIASRQ